MNVNDLATMANIIDICTQRGAFRGNELKQVGELFEKITAFVKEAQEKADAAEAEKSTEAEPAVTGPGE
jgi:hypothetical protein